MIRKLFPVFLLILAAGVASAQTVDSVVWSEGETAASPKVGTVTAAFVAVAPGVTQHTIRVEAKSGRLVRVLFTSADCVDCDAVLSTGAAAGTGVVVWEEANTNGATVDNTVYTLHEHQLPAAPFRITKASGHYDLYLRCDNNDLGARTWSVTLIFES